jgi:RNA polymerase sigma factor (sigma-70 family)
MNRYDGFDEKLISIVHLCARRLFQMRILRSMDMDDIEQELMLHAINSVKNYNSNLGSFHNFLEAVIQKRANKLLAMNSCLKRGGNSVFEEFAEDMRVDHASEVDVDRIISLADFDKATAVLSTDQRTLCELARRYSMRDISRILNVNRTTLYSRLKVILRTMQNVCRSQSPHRPNHFLTMEAK